MKQYLTRTWLTRGWLPCLLWPLAQLYGLAVRLRRAFYRWGLLRSERFGIPVIVVGNVVAGGAGKTPLVMALVRHLQARGLQVGVVSRGFGRTASDVLEVHADTCARDAGDEPVLLKRATGAPVFVGPKRTEAVRALLATYPATAVVVCDDGLQHYALRRDIEIAVFDDRGLGNGWLLPAGPLREPWPARQRQGVNLVLHTGSAPAFAGFRSRRELASHAVSAKGSRLALDALRGQPVVAMAGIANPQAFFAMLRQRGLTLNHILALPDHHDFSGNELAGYPAGQVFLCTEKDAVKLFSQTASHAFSVYAVPLEFSPETAFFTALDELLQPLLHPDTSRSPLPSSHGHQTT